MGISLFEDNDPNTYKSTYQILKDISEIWDELEDKQQAKLLEKLAGKRGGQVVASLLGNFDAVEKALKEMENAAGSADAEMEVIRDSIAYKLNDLKQTWVGTTQTLINKEDFKNTIDALTKLSEAIGLVVDKAGLLGTIGMGLGAFAGVKGYRVTDFLGGLDNIALKNTNAYRMLNGTNFNDTDQKAILNFLQLKESNATFGQLKGSMQGATKEARAFAIQAGRAKISSEQMTQAFKAQATAANLSAKASKAASIALNTFVNVGIMFAISVITQAIISCAKASENLAESARKFGDEFSSTKKEIDDYKTKIDALKETINSSTSTYKQTYDARVELMGIQDELITKFGKEASAIDIVTESINNQTDALDKLSDAKWLEIKNKYNDSDDIFDFIENTYNNAKYHTHSNYETMQKIMGVDERKFKFMKTGNKNDEKEIDTILGGMYGASKSFQDPVSYEYSISGNLYDQLKIYKSLQLYYEKLGDKVNSSSFGSHVSDTEELIEKYESMYNQSILYDKIRNSESYKLKYNDIKSAYKNYYDLRTTGASEEEVKTASENYAKIVSESISDITDESVIRYLSTLYPSMQEEVGKWQLQVDLEAAISDDKNDLEKDLEEIGKQFSSDNELKLFNGLNATDDQKIAYLKYAKLMQDYSLTDDQLIEKLIENNYLNNGKRQNLIDDIFKRLSNRKDISISKDEISSQIGGLSDEDVEYAMNNSSKFSDILISMLRDEQQYKDNITAVDEEIKQEKDKFLDWLSDLPNVTESFANSLWTNQIDIDANNPIKTKFGNVDMDKRVIIEWNRETLKTYEEALKSWNELNWRDNQSTWYQNIFNDLANGYDSYDTVHGSEDIFKLDGQEIGVAFTPIMLDKDGNPQVLSHDTVYNYIQTVLNEADKAISESGEEWTPEAVYKKALEIDLNGINTEQFNSAGEIIGNEFVHGIIAGIDNYNGGGNDLSAGIIGNILHFVGKFGSLNPLKKSKEESQKNIPDNTVQKAVDITKNSDYVPEKTFEELWDSLKEDKKQGEPKEIKSQLEELAKQGHLTAEKLKEIDGAESIFNNIGISAEEATKKINGLVDASTQLESMSKDVSKMSDVLKTKKENKWVDTNTLSGFSDEVRGLDAWEEFERVMGDKTIGMKEAQKAANDLAAEWVNDNNFLANLNETNKDFYITQLKAMGVSNAREVVESRLEKRFNKLVASVKKYNSVISNNADVLTDASSTDEERKESIDKIKEALSDAMDIDAGRFKDDFIVNNIDKIKEAANGSSEALRMLYKYLAIDTTADIEINAPSEEDVESYRNQINNLILNADIENFEIGTSLNDTPLIQGLQAMVDQGVIARDTMNKILAGIGVEPVWTFKDVPFTMPVGNTTAMLEAGRGIETATGHASLPEIQYRIKNNGSTSPTLKPPRIDPDGSTSSSGGGSGSDKESEETFDWIEVKLKRLQEAFSKFQAIAENTFKTLAKRQKAYADAIAKTEEEISTQQQAYDRYMQEANSIGLSEEWAKKVRDGSIDISKITDEDLKKKIQQYQEWYEKAKQAGDSLEELEKRLTELKIAKIQIEIDIKAQKLTKLEALLDRLQFRLDLSQLFGGLGSSSTYDRMNNNIQQQIENLREQNALMQEQANLVDHGSQAWWEYQNSINQNNSSINQLLNTIAQNAQNAANLRNEKLDKRNEERDRQDELSRLRQQNSSASGYRRQNSHVDEEERNLNGRLRDSANTVDKNKTSLKKAKDAVRNVKRNKENKKIIEEARKLIKAKKQIPASLLEKASKLGDNGALYTALVNYNAALAALETSQQQNELLQEQSQQDRIDLIRDRMSNIEQYYGNRQGMLDQRANRVNNAMELAEAQGYTQSTIYYQELEKIEKNKRNSLIKERAALQEQLEKGLKSGAIKQYSNEWYELVQRIDDVTNAIGESDLSIQNLKNQMRQIKWDRFDALQQRLSSINTELNFMINELSRKKLTDENTGWLTDEGQAAATLHLANYRSILLRRNDIQKELNKIKSQIEKDPNNTALIDRQHQLEQQLRDTTSAAQDEKYAIIELYKQGYDALISKIGKLISEYEKLLDSQKDAYDYQQKLEESAKNIATLRKQLAAYAGDVSEETRAKVQKLTVELENAEKNLKETQYDHMISEQKKMLSEFQEDLQKNIQDVIDNLDKNFEKIKDQLIANQEESMGALKDLLQDIGYDPTDDVDEIINGNNVWIDTRTEVTNIKNKMDKLIEAADKIAQSMSLDGANTTAGMESFAKDRKASKKELSEAEQKMNLANSEYTKASKDKEKIDEKVKNQKQTLEKIEREYMKAVAMYGKDSKQATDWLKAKESAQAKLDEYRKQAKEAKTKLEQTRTTMSQSSQAYENAKLKKEIMDYLNTRLSSTSTPRSGLNDINKVFYDKYGQTVITNEEIEEIAKMLGITKINGTNKSSNLYKRLKEIGIPGFKIGSRNILKDQIAALGEDGFELQFKKAQGTLGVVGQGDKIFTNEQAENLWKLSKMNIPNLLPNVTPNIVPVMSNYSMNKDVNIQIGDILLPDVTDPKQFASALKDVVKNDSSVQRMLKDSTIGSLSKNNNSLGIRKY